MNRLFLISLTASSALAAPVDFVREVQPILAENCAHCHGTDEADRRGGLRLDTAEGALKGGESDGAAIVPGKPEASPVIKRITSTDADEVMPPKKHKKLTSTQIDTLKRWISEGANYAKHWAFETPKPVSGAIIDEAVKAKLAGMKLTPAAKAEPATLIRRLHLDLVGLPPSPEVVQEFEAGKRTFESEMKRLMALPQFGEKWARHWLDVARYSDSNGYEKDLVRDQWAWRDWVIKAFNNDMPYDQFIVEQLAGDMLPKRTQDQLVATGFLRNSMINEEGAIVPEQFRMDEMFDRLDCLGKAMLGISVQCAQCHSHKFDPISHQEYYGLFAFLNNSYEAQSWVYSAEQQKQVEAIARAVTAQEAKVKTQLPKWAEQMATWEKTVIKGQPTWKPLKAVDLHSTGGLNHPTLEADLSIMTEGHPTTKGDIFAIFEPELKDATGLRLEALCHGNMPMNGPGRSYLGTWAISEMKVETQAPGATGWTPVKLVNATADFSETDALMEEEWWPAKPAVEKRKRGPVAYLIDGDVTTGWRADRGPGLRNQASVAVVQFEKPLTLTKGTRMKVTLDQSHGGGENGRSGRRHMQLGRCRISCTTAAAPKAMPIDHAAILAMQVPAAERSSKQQADVFSAWRRTVPAVAAINKQIAAEWAKTPEAKTTVLHLAERERGDMRLTKLLERGSWEHPKEVVPASVPAVFHPMDTKGPPPSRLDFARWMASEQSPLTARVAVNRVWQAIFGQGLVETSEDFGTRAPVPEYQNILDGLAVDFMKHRWSHKHLIQTILSSHIYQQASKAIAAVLEVDPKNRLLTRGPRFRLEAEMIRDGALSAAGLLNTKDVGGPSIFPPVPQSVLDFNYFKPTYWIVPTDEQRYRRSLYVFRKRSMPDPLLSNFDAPNSDAACARRVRSNTPLSALAGLNETTFVEAAQAMAQRVVREGGNDEASRVDYAYRLCVARAAKAQEKQSVLALLEQHRTRLKAKKLKAVEIAFSDFTKPANLPVDATPNDLAAWTLVCRVLLNLDETLTKF